MTFSDFLEQQYLNWQQKQGRRKSLEEFSRFLGIKQSTFSMWLSGDRKPGKENADKLALHLGPAVYDALGLPRPDPDLTYITRHWENVPPELRRQTREIIAAYIQGEKSADDNTKKTDAGTLRAAKKLA